VGHKKAFNIYESFVRRNRAELDEAVDFVWSLLSVLSSSIAERLEETRGFPKLMTALV
jgi:hypothetical protein